ncbi:aminoglycoside phosphotransferase family protein [Arthrobacter echini]|uniref:Aminoglycoside phosphotransferase family protein n=1 Tax=Arthrobacter echini TaxID=1529066 RepID=A0A4S5E286_9MICC|nr:aminoglycoside phosphotransferase family protein [Arthrobacter echini]THJ65511.1 aminoglycoside phosphotransferase family protein [Arthrobacter echini]
MTSERRRLREQDTIGFLASPGPGELLRATLAAAGWELGSWTLDSLHHRPGAGVTGLFSLVGVRAVSSTDARNPAPPTMACITSCATPSESDHRVVPRGDSGTLTSWLHPADPLLPGLGLALDADRATALAFGDGVRPEESVPVLRSYRPLRRAVVVVRNGQERRYLKVLRPGMAEPLVQRHSMLRAAGIPAPTVTADPQLDVVAMRAAPGEPLAELLLRDGAAEVDPHALVRLLTSLPRGVLELPVRAPWTDRVRDYAEGAVAALPSEAMRIRGLARRIDRVVRATGKGALVPSHGDFYEANLLIAGGAVSGLLDVDALGPGHLVDDLACCVGHLAVLPGLHPGYVRVPAALARFLRAFDDHVDPVTLRAGAAAVALTLVAGARRRAHGGGSEALSRLVVAERFLDAALAGGRADHDLMRSLHG